MKIIEERKNQKAEYQEYLQKIVELTRKIEKPGRVLRLPGENQEFGSSEGPI